MKKVTPLDAPPLFSPNEARCWSMGWNAAVDKYEDEHDPTPWCHKCGNDEKGCKCGPYAENH